MCSIIAEMVYRDASVDDAPLQRGAELLQLDLKRELKQPFTKRDTDATTVTHRPGVGVVARFKKPKYYYRWSLDQYAIADICIRATAKLPSVNAPVALHARRFNIGQTYVGFCAHCRPRTGQYRFEVYSGTTMSALTHWARSDVFADGDTHTLELRAAGDLFVFLAEDRVVATLRDRSFGRGYPALEVGNTDIGEETIVESLSVFEIE